jgi:hypothetical protein
MTKDMKLAGPSGISGCDADTCAELVESRWAKRSKENIVNNLKAAQVIFLGAAPGVSAVGLDDLLESLSATALAEQMAAALEEAISAAQAINGNLLDALNSQLETVHAAHAAAKALTDLMKTQFVSVLNLEVPQRAASDND